MYSANVPRSDSVPTDPTLSVQQSTNVDNELLKNALITLSKKYETYWPKSYLAGHDDKSKLKKLSIKDMMVNVLIACHKIVDDMQMIVAHYININGGVVPTNTHNHITQCRENLLEKINACLTSIKSVNEDYVLPEDFLDDLELSLNEYSTFIGVSMDIKLDYGKYSNGPKLLHGIWLIEKYVDDMKYRVRRTCKIGSLTNIYARNYNLGNL